MDERLAARVAWRVTAWAALLAAGTQLMGSTRHAAGDESPALPAVPFAEGVDQSSRCIVETAVAKLENPYGLAVRPTAATAGPYELFLSESGAGRVVRLSTDRPSELAPVVTDVPVKLLDDKPAYALGPLGLEFLTRTKLAVGTGGLGLGNDVIRVYALAEDGTPLAFDAADHAVGPIAAGPRASVGQGVFLSLAKVDNAVEKALFVAGAGDPEQGWLLKAKLAGNRLTDLQLFAATRKLTGVPSPSATTINPKLRAGYLVVAQAGARDGQRDSTVAFYGPASGAMALHLQTGLYDVSALAYSPSGDLYAADFAWHDAEAGGVYRLEAAEVAGLQGCRAVKIAAVPRPTGLTFTPDGTLWVAAFGNPPEGATEPAGVLLKVTPAPGAPRL